MGCEARGVWTTWQRGGRVRLQGTHHGGFPPTFVLGRRFENVPLLVVLVTERYVKKSHSKGEYDEGHDVRATKKENV